MFQALLSSFQPDLPLFRVSCLFLLNQHFQFYLTYFLRLYSSSFPSLLALAFLYDPLQFLLPFALAGVAPFSFRNVHCQFVIYVFYGIFVIPQSVKPVFDFIPKIGHILSDLVLRK